MRSSKPIDSAEIEEFDRLRREDPVRIATQHAFAKLNIEDMCFNGNAAKKMLFKFSNEIKTMSCTNQRSSGRCWLFAATNILREKIAKELNIDAFELSQSYLAFWDKFERCNYYLESVIDTASLPASDRTVSFITDTAIGDGGQWDMFINIVKKYGIVPKDAFPETFQSENTGSLNKMINLCLRRNTSVIRKMIADGADEKTVNDKKNEVLAKCWGFLVSCYGNTPDTFDFEYVDKDGKYHKDCGFTPVSFFEKFVGNMLDDCISIINAPTSDKPFNRMYTVKYLGNIIGGSEVRYLNLDMATFKKLVLKQLCDGEPVWFGSDCGKYSERTKKQWDPDSFDYEVITGLDVEMTKAEMLDYHVSQMNHAMVLTGANIDENGNADRWKVENSWGTDGANGGYHMASDKWFDLFVYQAVINIKYLGELEALVGTEPIGLEPWDPMGSLAD